MLNRAFLCDPALVLILRGALMLCVTKKVEVFSTSLDPWASTHSVPFLALCLHRWKDTLLSGLILFTWSYLFTLTPMPAVSPVRMWSLPPAWEWTCELFIWRELDSQQGFGLPGNLDVWYGVFFFGCFYFPNLPVMCLLSIFPFIHTIQFSQ